MKPVIALLGSSIFITTVSTSLRIRKELTAQHLCPSSATINEQLRVLSPNALLLDPITACPKRQESILRSFAEHLSHPVALFEFCSNNQQLQWSIISPMGHSADDTAPTHLVKAELPPEKLLSAGILFGFESRSYEIACVESLVQAITEVCSELWKQSEKGQTDND